MKALIFGLTAISLVALAPGLSYSADCTTKVGAVLPTSVDWGRPIAATARMAVDLYNKAGGVKGCKVELILRDTQVDPKVGVDAAKALVDLDKVPVLIGAVSSGVSMPILTSVSVPSNVMQISCCSSSTVFTGLAKDGKTKGLWFRTFTTSRNHAAVAAKIIKAKGYNNLVIFYKNDDWGQDIGKLVKADLEALGVTVKASIAINDGQPSYRAEVVEALKSNPEAAYVALYPKEGIATMREWISLGGTQNLVVANSLRSEEFRDSVGIKYLGKMVGHDSAAPRTASAASFTALYKEAFKKEPSGPGLPNIFDAVMIALLAMEASPTLSGDVIARSVSLVTDPNGTPIFPDEAGIKQASALLAQGKTIRYQGGTGAVTFDQYGDVSAPGLSWKFSEKGIVELDYITSENINEFINSLKK